MNSPADNSVPSYLMGDASETLLNLKPRADDSETGRWLTNLVTDALEIAAHGDAEQPVTAEDVNVMVKWVAQLFDQFELYKIAFNQKAAGSDLIVGASPLNLENFSAANDHFEAHLSTRHWSLAFDASTRKLDVYLIPAKLLLAFTTSRMDETEYKPFITFTARRHSDEYYWLVDKQLITFDMLPELAKELFGDLIKVASGNITEEAFFRNAPNETGSTAKSAASTPPIDRSFEVETLRASGFESESGGTAMLKDNFAGRAQSSEHQPRNAEHQPRNAALTEEFFALCNSFAGSIDSEMHAVIEFARLNSEDVELLKNCKQILIEMDALRVATTQTSEKLRALQS